MVAHSASKEVGLTDCGAREDSSGAAASIWWVPAQLRCGDGRIMIVSRDAHRMRPLAKISEVDGGVWVETVQHLPQSRMVHDRLQAAQWQCE